MVIVAKSLFLNNYGFDNLIRLTSSTIWMYSSTIQRIWTFSRFIFVTFDSDVRFTDSNFSNFYPNLVKISSSSLGVLNCIFYSSHEKIGSYEISTILIENYAAFNLENCTFDSIRNNLQGAVMKFRFFWNF